MLKRALQGGRKARRVAILFALAGLSCGGDPPPLGPDPAQRLTGTYTFTVTMSSSCRTRQGPWVFRADIQQNGRDFKVTLYDGHFELFGGGAQNEFKGQDNPDGLLFFGQTESLFWEVEAGLWHKGQARGQFRDGRIDALFNGEGNDCAAADHSWTFVRR